jgi:hypothetical protein
MLETKSAFFLLNASAELIAPFVVGSIAFLHWSGVGRDMNFCDSVSLFGSFLALLPLLLTIAAARKTAFRPESVEGFEELPPIVVCSIIFFSFPKGEEILGQKKGEKVLTFVVKVK